jgi:GNAT superfamily N-acetyltransferase
MSVDDLTFRTATPDDAARMAVLVVEGFETYRAFAPATWRPPTAEHETVIMERGLGRPDVWSMLAEHGGDLVGHAAVLPAAAARRPVADARLAHLWYLFVRPAWWGSGLASRLHDAAVSAARASGFTAMRLFTPAGQQRARRFYEREGWVLVDAPTFDEGFGLGLAEYRLALEPAS